jgi:hypothetical protein
MAITVVSSSNTTATGQGSITLSITVASGTDCLDIDICNSDGSPASVTGVTVNGGTTGVAQVFTKLGTNTGAFAHFLRATKYRCVGPSTGTYDVVATLSTTNDEIEMGVTHLSGVDQTNPIRDSDTTDGEDNSAGAINLTTVAGDYVSDTLNAGGFNGNDPAITWGGTQVQRWTNTANAPYIQAGGSYFMATGTSTNMSASFSAVGETIYAHVYGAAAYAPATGGGGATLRKNSLMRLGVGR